MKSFCTIIATILIAVGCMDIQTDLRFYFGPVSADALAGTWIIETKSIPMLRDLGYVQFTNELDHVLLLNPDGTCSYRGFDDYAMPALWFNRSEFVQHDGFLREGSAMWPHGVPDAKSWYIWMPTTTVMISGPYEQTNALNVIGESLQKNRWTRWKLQDGKVAGTNYEDDFGTKYRYRVRLSHSTFNAETFFLLGKDDNGFFLWKPVEDRMDGTALLGKMICFRQKREPEGSSKQ